MKKLKWLFGFRSGTPWKMIVAVLYYFVGLAILFFGLFSPPLIHAEGRDLLLYRLTILILFLWVESPALFLSDTPLRKKLPFFKQENGMMSLAGMMLVCVIFVYLFATVENFHSEDYKTRFNSYMSGLYGVETQIP